MGGKFLNNIKNSLNGLHFGFGIPHEQIKIVAALHGPATLLNYDDFIWNKYKIGAWLEISDPSTNRATLKNPYYASKAGESLHYSSEGLESGASVYQDTSIETLQHRGVKLLSCHTATEELVRTLIAQQNLTTQPELIVKDMLAHALRCAGCRIDGCGYCTAADGWSLQLHHGLRQKGRECCTEVACHDRSRCCHN